MGTPLYLLQGTLFRTQSKLYDLIEINEIFQDINPIVAREQVFNKYQSYVDVFLESQGLVYESNSKAEKALGVFIYSKRKQYALNKPFLGLLDVDFDKGLFIYLVTDPMDVFTTLEGEKIYNKKHLIHCMNNEPELFNEFLFSGLQAEYEFYKSNGFSTKDYTYNLEILDFFGNKNSISILKTPIDF